MKATDRQLINISEELTAHIITPKGNLNLSRDECIILNRLISEEFERRQEQDVMGSSNRQDTSLGQTGADNNDGNINASECRDNEASGTSLREKKKPQITKVSKKEYWDNRDKHGTYIETYFETCDMTDETPNYAVGSFGYERERLANEVEDILKKNGINLNETTDEITQLDDLKDTEKINSEIKVSKGAMSIDVYKLFGHSFDDKSLNFGGMPLLDKYIPIAWIEERIRVNKKFPFPTSFEGYDAVYQSVIGSWKAFGRDDWYKNVHDESC